EYVMQHWKEDFMFGYQFLNGCNPVVIEKCTRLPDKFPVTDEMVSVSLERGLTLEEEIQAGNIYIVDYELLDGIKPNSTDPCTQQYIAAPICLLYKNLENKIMPIAIQVSYSVVKEVYVFSILIFLLLTSFQLKQIPGEDNPIFLPTDAEYDWLLAKIWVRSADFQHHQTVTHLLRTHLMSEMFAIAMFRQLPAVHPAFKLLIPHVRYTIAINTKAREQLICECGIFDKLSEPASSHWVTPNQVLIKDIQQLYFFTHKANATGGGGHVQLVQKGVKSLKFRSLCFPDSIKARGVHRKEDLPTYFYRDDGYKVWEVTKSFVSEVVHLYYKDDDAVKEDEEIQAFVKDVRNFGTQNFEFCEFPKSLKTLGELTEYLTIVVFTASAQHAAVNFGQYDWCSWIPNAPSTMRQPPPNQKGLADVNLIVDSLPDRGRSSWHLGAVWALSQYQESEVDSYVVNVDDDLGEIVLVKLQMKRFLVCDDWYCRYITVKTPSGQCVEFPCFRWLVNDEEVVLRDGREYVMQHWKEDFMFGYQFLNGCNPVVIEKCTRLPDKFPVTDEMVSVSLERGLTLEEEIQAGNIYMADFELLDGVKPNDTDPRTQQYIAAPICLFYKNLENKIIPIAIQLNQIPGEDNPIFLPTDAEYDWLLAKIWVRSTDFQHHQTVTHLLRTHLMSEMFAIAMFRQLPAVHPAFKLLIPHVRYTIAINTKAREQLICDGGLFDKANATGGGGYTQLLQKAMKTLTFGSLCFPGSLKARGVDSREELPTYFYRDDGLEVWEATKRSAFVSTEMIEWSISPGSRVADLLFSLPSFVSEVVSLHYKDDEAVQHDHEIQAFVKDVQKFGMKALDHCGEFKENKNVATVQVTADLTEFPFLCNRVPRGSENTRGAGNVPDRGYFYSFSSARSGQLWTGEINRHRIGRTWFKRTQQKQRRRSLLSTVQFDWCSWVPNTPSTMRRPPPKQKGLADMSLIMNTLPDCGRSAWHLGAVWALSQYQKNELYLGTFPDEHFTEEPAKAAMGRFRQQLADITSSIKRRNEGKELPYYNMSPDKIPNSVAI
ncbi:unnamed protein product, partial [Tetraodon nigroviridis]